MTSMHTRCECGDRREHHSDEGRCQRCSCPVFQDEDGDMGYRSRLDKDPSLIPNYVSSGLNVLDASRGPGEPWPVVAIADSDVMATAISYALMGSHPKCGACSLIPEYHARDWTCGGCGERQKGGA